jgi:hypothetical protein
MHARCFNQQLLMYEEPSASLQAAKHNIRVLEQNM